MSMFRRKPRQPKYDQRVLTMKVAGGRGWFQTTVDVRAFRRDTPQVCLYMETFGDKAVGFLTEDEVRTLARALLNAIEQSKAFTARESG